MKEGRKGGKEAADYVVGYDTEWDTFPSLREAWQTMVRKI